MSGRMEQATVILDGVEVWNRHTRQQWEELVRICCHLCFYCGESIDLSTASPDHLLPISRGGSDLILNIVPACFRCNQMKGKQTYSEFRRARPKLTSVGCEQFHRIRTAVSSFRRRERSRTLEDFRVSVEIPPPLENPCPELLEIVRKLADLKSMENVRPRPLNIPRSSAVLKRPANTVSGDISTSSNSVNPERKLA